MITVMQLIRKLRSPENKKVLLAVEAMRVRGWLEDGSLEGIPLCHAHLEGADLFKADLTKVDFHQANLAGVNLSMAILTNTKFVRANLKGVNFSNAIVEGADLLKANLQAARNLTEEQLATTKRLYGAIMPD